MRRLDGTTIVFDLDGTLVDTAPDLIAAANHVLTALSLPSRPPLDLRPWISFGARRMIEEALLQSGERRSPADVDRLLEAFLEHYEANIARLSRPFPHVVDGIHEMRAAGARIAVCTNKRESLSIRLLDELALTPLFAAIVGRDTLPVSKPHPAHLLGTIERAGGSPSNAVMIGDSGVDVATARSANVPIIGVTFGYTDSPISSFNPDKTLDDYRNLIDAVATLVATN